MIESPVFLKNLAYLISGSQRGYRNNPDGSCKASGDYRDDISILFQFKPLFEKWIAEHRVAGSRENARVVRRGLKIYTKIADFSLLSSDHQLNELRDFTMRLKGLICA